MSLLKFILNLLFRKVDFLVLTPLFSGDRTISAGSSGFNIKLWNSSKYFGGDANAVQEKDERQLALSPFHTGSHIPKESPSFTQVLRNWGDNPVCWKGKELFFFHSVANTYEGSRRNKQCPAELRSHLEEEVRSCSAKKTGQQALCCSRIWNTKVS